jgi:hypothetical protein
MPGTLAVSVITLVADEDVKAWAQYVPAPCIAAFSPVATSVGLVVSAVKVANGFQLTRILNTSPTSTAGAIVTVLICA